MARYWTSTILRAAAAVAAVAAAVPAAGSFATSESGKAKNPAPMPCTNKAPIVSDIVASWQRFPAPTFTTAVGGSVKSVPQEITAYAVDPHNENRIVVTNGNQIQVSNNGGCSWFPAIRLDDVPTDPQHAPIVGAAARIDGVYISAAHMIYATVEEFDSGASVGHPHVLLSPTGQVGSWSTGDTGLPPVGHPLTMKASVTDPDVVYLSFAETSDDQGTPATPCPPPPLPCPGGGGGNPQASAGLLWRSTDGGRTWANRTDPQDLNGAAVIKYFSIADDDPSGNTVWVVANGLLRRSTNGGQSFAIPVGAPQDGFTYTAVEWINRGDYPNTVKLIAFGTGNQMLRLDRGRWIRSTVQFSGVQSISQLPDTEIVVSTGSNGGYGASVWRIFAADFNDFESRSGLAYKSKLRFTFGWEQVTPHDDLSVPPDASAGDRGSNAIGTFYVRTKKSVLRFLGSTLRNGRLDVTPEVIGAPPPPQGHISPALLTLNLPTGASKTVSYKLTLPPAPTPIDLDLLIDNSGSMEPLIEDLKQNLGGIVRSLVRRGVDVNVGVGEINVQPDAPPIDNPRTTDVDESKPPPIFRRLRAIGPVDTSLFQALSYLDGNGGNGEESQLESLWQTVTGEGWSTTALPFLSSLSVPPGQDARFRDGSIRVVVHATDEQFSEDIYNGHNAMGPVIQALKDADVRQIGLSQGVVPEARGCFPISDRNNANAYCDLAYVARGTGAIAPAAGVDCDGDGHRDITAGHALVCPENYGLDKTIVNLLGSIQDHGTIKLTTGSMPTLRTVSRASWYVDVKQPTRVTFSVTYSCAGLQPGGYDNDLTASLRNAQIAKAVTTVNCGGVTTPVRFPPDEPANNPPAPLPQPVAPAIVPANPIPQAQSQVQSQINPQGGLADQEEQQHQVATAQNDITSPDGDEELAMSRVSDDCRWGPLAANIAGMAFMSAVATGVALRRRTRAQVARAR